MVKSFKLVGPLIQIGIPLAFLQSVYAQVGPLPTSAEPGRVNEQVLPRTPEAPAINSGINAPVEEDTLPPEAANFHFVLRSVDVEGATVYRPGQLEPIYTPYLGRDITLRDAYHIAAMITQKYRQDGYFLSRAVVPQQNITNGHLVIQVVEGFVSKVIYQQGNATPRPSRMLRRIARQIEDARPLKMSVLEKNMLLLNEMPGRTAHAVLQASADVPGAADVYILLTEKRVGGYIQTDNRGSRYQGPLEFIGGVNLNQVFDDQDQLGVRAATTYQTHEQKFGEIAYQRILTPQGLRFSLLANNNLTHPGFKLAPFEIQGQDNLYEAKLSYPVLRQRFMSGDAYTQLDWHDVASDALKTPLSRDHLRVARIGYTQQNYDSLNGVNVFNVELSQGLDAFGATAKGGMGSRPAASPGFHKATFLLSRDQKLRTSPWSVYGSVTGQYAPKALLASEEFGVGGERFGSGYDSSEITGDSGIAGRVEARYLVVPKTSLSFVNTLQPYAFYDVGMVHNVDPGVGQKATQSLASAGGGIRMGMIGDYNLSLEVAKPLSRDVAALNSKSPRVFFKLSKTF